MINDSDVINFILSHPSYDIRVSHNARWIDQKCTPDVLAMISDCIMDYDFHNPHSEFTSQDIWHSDYARNNVFAVFQKPDVNSSKAIAEYNKFFMQPMELLAYSGVLKRIKRGNQNIYSIINKDVLEYIAIRERNAIKFLASYIEKVLKDSNIFIAFDMFFARQTSTQFDSLKDSYTNFIIANTPINGAVEVHRIFTKVINPLAYVRNAYGAERGHMSKDIITFDMLMYNRKNFRDIYSAKPKDVTRKEHASSGAMVTPSGAALTAYLVNRAKKYVRQYNIDFNAGRPEYTPESGGLPGTHVHHIFPEASFPTLADVVENLICITPGQHLSRAHPGGNTSRIDTNYQALLLVAKADTIEQDYSMSRGFYDFDRFVDVLVTGYNDNDFSTVAHLDFPVIKSKIMKYYISGTI
jgi:hypothetical protein